MIIGLFDYDIYKNETKIFNLELMKMATYYKKKGIITTLSPLFKPENYTKFYIQSDYLNYDLPKNITKYDNIEMNGITFNKKYIPMKKDIEICAADTSIYRIYQNLYKTKLEKELFNRLLQATHIRLSLDGYNVWNKYNIHLYNSDNISNLIIHDYNILNIQNYKEELNNLINICPNAKFSFKFPIYFNNDNIKELYNFIKIPKLSTDISNEFIINEVLSDKNFIDLIDHIPANKNHFIVYDFLKAGDDLNIMLEKLNQVFNHILFLRNSFKLISLKNNPLFPYEIQEIIKMYNFLLNNGMNRSKKCFFNSRYKETVYDIINKMNKQDYKKHHLKSLEFLKQNKPELYNKCMNIKKTISKGGKIYIG